jgi:hypothetical protein
MTNVQKPAFFMMHVCEGCNFFRMCAKLKDSYFCMPCWLDRWGKEKSVEAN